MADNDRGTQVEFRTFLAVSVRLSTPQKQRGGRGVPEHDAANKVRWVQGGDRN